MATGNGHDPATVERIEVMRALHAEVKSLHTEMRAGLAEVHEDLAAIRAEVSGVKNEVSGLRVEARVEVADLRERAGRLEAAVFKPAAE